MSSAIKRLTDFIRKKPRGEDVRTAIADAIDTMDDAIDTQLLAVTEDLTDTNPNHAIQAGFIGDILYSESDHTLLKPRVFNNKDATGHSTSSPMDISDIPWFGSTAFVNSATFAQAPDIMPTYESDSGMFTVTKIPTGRYNLRAAVICYDFKENDFYFGSHRQAEGAQNTVDKWKKVCTSAELELLRATLETKERQKAAAYLYLLKHLTYIDQSANGQYQTQMFRNRLSEVSPGQWELSFNINALGQEQHQFEYCATTDTLLPCGSGEKFYYGGSSFGRFNSTINQQGRFFAYLHEYSANRTFIKRSSFLASNKDPVPVTTSSECAYIRFTFAYNAASKLTITQEDIRNYFAVYKEEEQDDL